MSVFGTVIWLLLAYATYYVAKQNNRNTTLAAILGLVFGLIALIVYMAMGKKGVEKE